MAVVAMSFVCVRVVMVMVVRMSVGRRVGVTAVHGALRSAEQTAGLRRFEEIHDLGTGRKAEGDVFKMMCVHDRIHDEAVHRHGHVHEAVLYNGWPVLVAEGMSELDAALDELIGGQLLEAFLLGLMCFAGMIILGIPYAFVISALVACLAVVPYIGSITSAVIGCIFIVISQPEKVIVFIIFFLILQRIEGDILYPRIVGKSVGLPELWLLVAAMIGAGLGGIMGMIISVPLCSVFYALFSDYIKRRLQTKKMNDI